MASIVDLDKNVVASLEDAQLGTGSIDDVITEYSNCILKYEGVVVQVSMQ